LKKNFKIIAVVVASVVALSYSFGYDYLFSAIAKTYFRGGTSATIDDGVLFENHTIKAGVAQPWEKDSQYNQQGLSPALTQELTQTKTASFLVIKNGKLLHEQYWDETIHTRTNSFSMAKGITVMLLGKALEEEKINNLDQKFSDFYQNYAQIPFGKNLTLHQLANMEAGLNWEEDYKSPFSPNAKAYYGKSLAKVALLRGFQEEPGTHFEYQSGATQLLGFALRKSLEMPLSEYLSLQFWQPLGMEQNALWTTDSNGMEKTFCCVHAESRDFAKLGQLLLNNGQWGELNLLSESFIEKMRTGTEKSNKAYGMGLWINEDQPIKHYYFWGLLGQYIIIIPEYQMIIVRTGSFENQPKDQKGRPKQVAKLVNETVKLFGKH
jgi:CubicO group peptidase (beta-lactamase class C family)